MNTRESCLPHGYFLSYINKISQYQICVFRGIKNYAALCLLTIIITNRLKDMGTMLTPETSAVILLVVSLLLLIIIPILDGTKRFSKYISLRYTLVAVALIMALGCVLDFSHLAESSRNTVLMGGLILVGLFVAARSLEKLKLGVKKIEFSAGKGDAKITATIHGEKSPLAKDTAKPNDAEKHESKEDNTDPDWEPSGSIDVDCLEDERGEEDK